MLNTSQYIFVLAYSLERDCGQLCLGFFICRAVSRIDSMKW